MEEAGIVTPEAVEDAELTVDRDSEQEEVDGAEENNISHRGNGLSSEANRSESEGREVHPKEDGKDKSLHSSSNGREGELEGSLSLVVYPDLVAFSGKNTKLNFEIDVGGNMEISSQNPHPIEDNVWSTFKEGNPVIIENDMVLDLIEAQPLQKSVSHLKGDVGLPEKNTDTPTLGWKVNSSKAQQHIEGGLEPTNDDEARVIISTQEQFGVHFPPLSAGRTKQLMRNFEKTNVGKDSLPRAGERTGDVKQRQGGGETWGRIAHIKGMERTNHVPCLQTREKEDRVPNH